jgi:hypothetical protein
MAERDLMLSRAQRWAVVGVAVAAGCLLAYGVDRPNFLSLGAALLTSLHWTSRQLTRARLSTDRRSAAGRWVQDAALPLRVEHQSVDSAAQACNREVGCTYRYVMGNENYGSA